MQIKRWTGSAAGRSRTSAFGELVWTVANASDISASFEEQAAQSLAMLETHLVEAGSARTHILSIQVILANINDRSVFDEQWREWIGANPEHWPQRACFQSALAPGLLVELIVVAAAATAGQIVNRSIEKI